MSAKMKADSSSRQNKGGQVGEKERQNLPAGEAGTTDDSPQTEKEGILTIRGLWSMDKVQIEIKDSGSGISPDHLKHLFEPFHTTKGDQGTGLGLYITKQLVERNGGRISVQSKEGEGTSFALEFKASNSKA